jgi:D-alanine-D-alanine ligase
MRISLLRSASDNGRPDDADTLVQASEIGKALTAAGHEVCNGVVRRTEDVEAELKRTRPEAVFNLVESFLGTDGETWRVAAALEAAGVPFTGCSSAALKAASDKRAAKRRMAEAGVAAPEGISEEGAVYIVKSVLEHASFGMDEESVVRGAAAAAALLRRKEERFGGEWFAERYIDGREFNVSLIGTAEAPFVLPLAEISFDSFPPDMPCIVDYRAKWEEPDGGYGHTPRRFMDEAREPLLAERLRRTALACWRAFGLSGYARVDFRVDGDGRPWALEINANPGLSRDAGFIAAAEASGMTYADAIARILDLAFASAGTQGAVRAARI